MAFKLCNKKLPKNYVKKEEVVKEGGENKSGSGSTTDSVNMEVDKVEGRGSQEHMPGPDLTVQALCRHLRMNIHPGGFSNSGAWEAPPPGPTYIYIYVYIYMKKCLFKLDPDFSKKLKTYTLP